jgi:hypothetical protein
VCCDDWTYHDDPVCQHCSYLDIGWAETLHGSEKKRSTNKTTPSHYLFATALVGEHKPEVNEYRLKLSSFSDTIELGFHLSRIHSLYESSPNIRLDVTMDMSSLAYDWDYSYDFDQERDIYLPPSIPLLSLVEAARFSKIIEQKQGINLKLILPPKNHAVTSFLLKTELFSPTSTYFSQDQHDPMHSPGCEDVMTPLTYVGASTSGQLSSRFHTCFNSLSDAGLIKECYRPVIRNVIMEAAENADSWGGQGWITCFLRQEKRGKAKWGHNNDFDPKRETHLFIHVFSIGSTLAKSTGYDTEWDAADHVTNGFSTRSLYGGNGIPKILKTVTQNSMGTVFMISGSYTRIISPDGLVREFMTAGSEFLPGFHLGAVIPLAVISDFSNNIIQVAGV